MVIPAITMMMMRTNMTAINWFLKGCFGDRILIPYSLGPVQRECTQSGAGMLSQSIDMSLFIYIYWGFCGQYADSYIF
ncbi:MAG: hypothetical protein A4E38_01522 [Methanoregulaceae archaeon PtaB.Bin108]|nr:MAG: hypothetical protein A4E38_01522 [Methanoregulaceae archaeon PtaB.Bin108]